MQSFFQLKCVLLVLTYVKVRSLRAPKDSFIFQEGKFAVIAQRREYKLKEAITHSPSS